MDPIYSTAKTIKSSLTTSVFPEPDHIHIFYPYTSPSEVIYF
ncbi:MAG: hypothetical protein SCAL_000264 [Candidatus Syntrophoarchaeum caldarius]|uniref:Uncharacterized protein n=1 Tax=Candidatus Syntropharchaeum caldarium TaxID=1838285 RepID=A0A1F2PBH7_9EURY|nr:MAG: hypothetical protein SCAL_000264 [Candidatus Syntrophoarchaeum caldarius]